MEWECKYSTRGFYKCLGRYCRIQCQDPQGKPSSGVSYSFQRVPAITPNELRGLPEGRLLVFLAGLSSVVVADAPWWEDVPQWRQAAGR